MVVRILKLVVIAVICVFSSMVQATNSSENSIDLKQAIVGVWAHDIEGTNNSIVIEFHDNGNFDILLYDRYNIASFDIAVGNYYVKNDKLHTMISSASGTLSYFQLYTELEINVLAVDNASLKISENGRESVYKLLSQRNGITIDDYI